MPVHSLLRIVTILLGVVLAVANPVQAQFFTVSGTVSDPLLVPVDSVTVLLFDTLGTPLGIPPTFTDALGFYSIAGLPPGSYDVGFEPPLVNKLLTALERVTVVASNITLNVQLQPGNLLSGVVTDTAGVGIFDIDLNVTDRVTNLKVNTPGDNTDSTGFYDVIVPTGKFDLKWRTVGLNPEPWIPVELRNVNINADTTINIVMMLGITVSGTVKDQLGSPVLLANLDFIDTLGTKLNTPGDKTDSLGFYSVQVPFDTYDIRVKPRPIDRLVGTDTLGVSLLTDTTFNFVLQAGLSLSGTVTDTAGAPVFDLDVDAADVTTGLKLFTPFDNTDTLGHYEVFVPPGVYNLNYNPVVGIPLLAPVDSLGVAIVQDIVINITLPPGLLLSGAVQDTFGDGVPGVDIDASVTATGVQVPLSGDHTDPDGFFSVVMPTGVYDIEVEPPKLTRLVAQKLPGFSLVQDSVIAVTLVPGLSVSGTVTDSVGTAMSNVDVDAILLPSLLEVFTPGDNSDSLGHYEIIIPPGICNLIYRPSILSGIPDSVLLSFVAIPADTIINVVFPIVVPTGIGEPPGPKPPVQQFALRQNYPNPFNPVTVIQFELAQAGRVSLEVYNVQGALVRVLYRGHRNPGLHEVRWNGINDGGQKVSSGIYFYRLQAAGISRTRKMILLK